MWLVWSAVLLSVCDCTFVGEVSAITCGAKTLFFLNKTIRLESPMLSATGHAEIDGILRGDTLFASSVKISGEKKRKRAESSLVRVILTSVNGTAASCSPSELNFIW
jgi:hypothetical protein